MEVRARPGGRSARVVQAVHGAVLELLAEPDWASLTLARVAERSGVHPATVYRRWSGLPTLVGAAMTAELAVSSPLPDSGSLKADVHRYAAKIAADLAGPRGPVLLRAAVLIGSGGVEAGAGGAVSGRTAEIDALLQRARDRGEPCASSQDFFECVVGPLYGYALFAPAALTSRAPVLVDRFLALPPLLGKVGRDDV